MGRLLGVDYGTHRLGFALTDPDRIIATAHAMHRVKSPKDAIAATMSEIESNEVEEVVVGLPLSMDGSSSKMTDEVRAFAETLSKATALPVRLWDERLTSKTAEGLLIESGTRREKRKELIDKIAAQIMLQHFLDSQSPDMGQEY